MATISENLQTIKDSTDAIKQAIINKGGTINGDISTWADAINAIESENVLNFVMICITTGYLDSDPQTFDSYYICTYENGMTWGEWVNSNYNTYGFYLSGDNIR